VSEAEVSQVPGPNLIPKSLSTGLLDPGWLAGTGASISEFIADCPSTIGVGNMVRIVGDSSVDLADATDSSTMPVIGVVTEKPSATQAKVQVAGIVAGVFSSLTPGSVYYLATGGGIAPSPPGGPGKVFVQAVGTAISTTELVINPSPNVQAFYR
jgi:hypothetical protein